MENKVVAITGGDSGIGLACARLFLAEGADVAIISNNPKTLESAKLQLGANVLAVKADVTAPETLRTAFEEISQRFGHVDVLFSGAGIAANTPLEGASAETVERVLSINLAGSFYTVQAALPYLRSGSSVILMGSIMATQGYAGLAIYAASKAGLGGMARSLATELTPRGIRVNTLVAGATQTAIWNGLVETEAQAQQVKDSVAKTIPLGRLNTADEVAQAALFLASDQSSTVHAAELVVDGGTSGAPHGAPVYLG
ncbi:SDR family oxidoreductase [Rhizobium favelukesii]|uniref:SDR family oxidoreductase n=1 Tax=Rhizobium favelukesii TaxID=348824 RepID=UPI001AEC1B72|nr:SDR family oxidoreductase [Rhizobium favelukesii]